MRKRRRQYTIHENRGEDGITIPLSRGWNSVASIIDQFRGNTPAFGFDAENDSRVWTAANVAMVLGMGNRKTTPQRVLSVVERITGVKLKIIYDD